MRMINDEAITKNISLNKLFKCGLVEKYAAKNIEKLLN